MQDSNIDINHLRTFFVHSKEWLSISGLESYLGTSRGAISRFIFQKQKNGSPQGLGQYEEIVLKWVRLETNYDPNRQYGQIV